MGIKEEVIEEDGNEEAPMIEGRTVDPNEFDPPPDMEVNAEANDYGAMFSSEEEENLSNTENQVRDSSAATAIDNSQVNRNDENLPSMFSSESETEVDNEQPSTSKMVKSLTPYVSSIPTSNTAQIKKRSR